MPFRLQPWLRHALFIALLLAISGVLFRGSLEQGMEMDEISRVINVIPILNQNAEPLPPVVYSVEILGRRVPVMFKQYISSAYLLRFLPLAFFDDYLFGIRFLHWFYFVLSISAFYLVLSRFNTYLAAFGALLIVTSPLYYPEVRISFADSLQILYLSLAGVFFERFFRRGQRKRDLFVGFLLLFGCANQMFYFCWVIAGLLAVGTILYPRMTLRCFCPLPRSVTVLLALMLGLANFVIYNVSQGFPTFAELIKRRFHPAATNTVAGDGHLLDMFANDLGRKLYQLPRYFDAPQLYTIIYGLVLLVTVVFAVHLMKRGRLWAKRICFAPGLATLVILFLILISPSTTRVGHYVYIVPFLQLSALAALLGLGQMFTARPFAWRMTVFLLAGALVTVNFVQSNRVISATNRSGGRHLFSPAIFDFVRYLNEHSIDSQDVLFTVWGLHLQPYFLNRGQFRIRQVVYQLILRKTAAEREAYLEHLFSSYHGLPVQGDALYLPVTATYRSDIRDELLDFLHSRHAKLTLEETFRERNQDPAILLYRLDSAREFVRQQTEPIRSAPLLESLHISRFGPQRVAAGREADLPMWFIATGLTPTTRVVLDGVLLDTIYGVDHCTALVPRRALATPGQLSLFLFNRTGQGRSLAVELEVR
jgi:hypothetical protein